MEFTLLTAAQKPLFDTFLHRDDIGWEYNFATLFTWNVADTMKYALEDDILLLYNVHGGKTIFLPPYVKNREDFARGLELLRSRASSVAPDYVIRGLTREQSEIASAAGMEISTDRDDYDYVYSADDLKYLKGKAFHSKRNFVTRFTASYEYEFSEYTPRDYDGLLALYDTWEVDATHPTLSVEKSAIIRAFTMREELGLNISVLKVNGDYAAFSITSQTGNGVNHCLFEKAETSYVGIYQAINKFTAEKYFADGTLVNRQEDMGIEGLRRAKLSLNPRILLEKFWAAEKQ